MPGGSGGQPLPLRSYGLPDSPSQDRRPVFSSNVPWSANTHGSRHSLITFRKAGAYKGRERELARQEVLLQEGTTIPNQPSAARMQGSSSMIDLSSAVRDPDHWVRLNVGFRSNLRWWELFLDEWNGTSLCVGVVPVSPFKTITSNASGRWGCGAFTGTGDWFQYQWPGEWDTVHITVKELLPIVVAVAVWGHQRQGRTIHCLCDNAAVVAIIRSGSSKDRSAMHLLQCLFFFTARYQVVLASAHIPGKRNEAADRLSRDSLFFSSWCQT